MGDPNFADPNFSKLASIDADYMAVPDYFCNDFFLNSSGDRF
jgi:hypothetical protein